MHRFAALLLTLLAATSYAQTPPARLRVVVPLDTSAAFDQALTDAVKDFNSTQSRFQVEMVRRGDSFQSLRAIIAAHYAGDLPDLALVNEADLPTLTRLNIVQPLPEKWVAGKKLIPDLVSKSKCGGKACSIPFQRRVPVWYFNKEWLFKFSQNPEKIPTAWPALSALSRKLQKPRESHREALPDREAPPENDTEVWGLALPAAGDTAIARWNALGLKSLGNGGAVESFSAWAQKMWETRANWVPGSPSADEASRRFVEQRAVVLLGALDQLLYMKANAAFKFGAALPEGDLSWFGSDFVVLGKGQDTRNATEFLDFLYKSDVALTLFKSGLTLPVSRAFADSASWKREIDQWPLLKAAAGRKLRSMDLEAIAPHVREELASTVWNALEQDIEPAQRPAKAAELRAALRKILSTNQH